MIRLIQEKYAGDPWRVLCVCAVLNRSKGTVSEAPIERLFRAYPNPKSLADASPMEVALILQSTGFQNRKADALIKLSKAFVRTFDKPGFNPSTLPGVGKYALESLRIFVDGNVDFIPDDSKLKLYVEERRNDRREKTV